MLVLALALLSLSLRLLCSSHPHATRKALLGPCHLQTESFLTAPAQAAPFPSNPHPQVQRVLTDQHGSQVASCHFPKAETVTSSLESPHSIQNRALSRQKTACGNRDDAPCFPVSGSCQILILACLPSPIFLLVGLSCLTKISATAHFL